MYTVYVRVDANNIIVDINSDFFIKDFSGWIPIERGNGIAFMHAQNNYLLNPLRDFNGSANYKMVNGKITERGEEEKKTDVKNYASDFLNSISKLEAAVEKITEVLNKFGMK